MNKSFIYFLNHFTLPENYESNLYWDHAQQDIDSYINQWYNKWRGPLGLEFVDE